MKLKYTLLLAVFVISISMVGCDAAQEAADEGGDAVSNGLATKDRAEKALEEKNERIDFDF